MVRNLRGAVRSGAKERPVLTTGLLTLAGYAVVIGTFAGALPIYPNLTESDVDILSHAIAIVNSLAVICLLLGWNWIKQRDIQKHKYAMKSAFTLIVLFLALYLPKVGGGGEKHFVLSPQYAWVPVWEPIHTAYLVMLAIHILLSVLAVPLVVFAIVLGTTHSPNELEATPHARVGRIAVITWVTSLGLGVVAYVLLNHLYMADFVPVTP